MVRRAASLVSLVIRNAHPRLGIKASLIHSIDFHIKRCSSTGKFSANQRNMLDSSRNDLSAQLEFTSAPCLELCRHYGHSLLLCLGVFVNISEVYRG